MLLSFSWTIILLSIGFQYMREKQYKSDFLSAQLQQYNRHLLETVEEGLPYEEYIAQHEKPFDNLRVSIITLSGAVVYDNMIPLDSLDSHIGRPEIAEAYKHGSATTSGASRQATDASTSTPPHAANESSCARPYHIPPH